MFNLADACPLCCSLVSPPTRSTKQYIRWSLKMGLTHHHWHMVIPMYCQTITLPCIWWSISLHTAFKLLYIVGIGYLDFSYTDCNLKGFCCSSLKQSCMLKWGLLLYCWCLTPVSPLQATFPRAFVHQWTNAYAMAFLIVDVWRMATSSTLMLLYIWTWVSHDWLV